MQFEAAKSALLLIDLQVGFCGDGGHISRLGRDVTVFAPVLASAGRLAAAARSVGMPVILTTMAFAPDYGNGGLTISDLRPNLKTRNALRADLPDRDIMPELDPQPSDIILEKQRYSALIKTNLADLLAKRGIEGVVVGGVTTSMCVESTVRDLAMHDWKVFIVPEACGDMKPDFHDRAMELFKLAFGRVVPEADMITAIETGSAEFPHQMA